MTETQQLELKREWLKAIARILEMRKIITYEEMIKINAEIDKTVI